VLDLISADDTQVRLQCAPAWSIWCYSTITRVTANTTSDAPITNRHPLERTRGPLEASGPVAQLDEASWAYDRTADPSAA
jgi:hypothetical protein